MRPAFVAVLALALFAPRAWSSGFADEGSRVFTLAHGDVSAIAALPGGDVVYATRDPDRLLRVTVDGRRYELDRDGADGLAVESARTVLRAPSSRRGLERVDVRTGAVTKLPLDASVDAVTVLEDGTAVAAAEEGLYAIAPGGPAVKLLPDAFGDGDPSAGLIALPRRRFAFTGPDGLKVEDLSGARRVLAAGSFYGPLAVSGDDGVLATVVDYDATTEHHEDEASRAVCVRPTAVRCTDWTPQDRVGIVRVGSDGAVTRLLTLPARPATALGNGDGLALFQELLPLDDDGSGGPLAVARDGSLLVGGRGLRALVPPASDRPRIAFTGFGSLRDGRIRYWTSRPGTVTATVGLKQARGAAVAAGDGELALGSVPPPGHYVLRLRLSTPTGGVAETVQRVDTRRVLALRDARAALRPAYEASDGDEGGGDQTRLGDCRRRSGRVIRCLLLYQLRSYEFDGPGRWSLISQPSAWATATLRGDGIHADARLLPHGYDEPTSCLRVRAAHHQHRAALTVRVQARCGARVHVAAHLHWRADRALQVQSRQLRRGQTWEVSLPLPRRVSSALADGAHVTGDLVVRVALPTRYGPIPEEHGTPIVID